MKTILESHAAVVTICILFAIALGLNSILGGSLPSFVNNLTFERGVSANRDAALLHGPTFPPDPWENKLAHGPTFPPDPWENKLAHGPTFPPDPWENRVAHGPTFPPDPWENKLAHGPTFPPDPWEFLDRNANA